MGFTNFFSLTGCAWRKKDQARVAARLWPMRHGSLLRGHTAAICVCGERGYNTRYWPENHRIWSIHTCILLHVLAHSFFINLSKFDIFYLRNLNNQSQYHTPTGKYIIMSTARDLPDLQGMCMACRRKDRILYIYAVRLSVDNV